MSDEEATEIVREFLHESYGFADEDFDEQEIDVTPDGEGHWVFDVWEGESGKGDRYGSGYVHPDKQVEGLY